jgi:hypothetical protein
MNAPEAVRRPIARQVHPDDLARFFAQGRHCEARRGNRRCQDPITVVSWRWFRSAAAGRVIVAERFLCTEHGQDFARRHRIEIEPPPPEPRLRPDRPGTEGGRVA